MAALSPSLSPSLSRARAPLPAMGPHSLQSPSTHKPVSRVRSKYLTPELLLAQCQYLPSPHPTLPVCPYARMPCIYRVSLALVSMY